MCMINWIVWTLSICIVVGTIMHITAYVLCELPKDKKVNVETYNNSPISELKGGKNK